MSSSKKVQENFLSGNHESYKNFCEERLQIQQNLRGIYNQKINWIPAFAGMTRRAMYEKKTSKLISRKRFAKRFADQVAFTGLLILISLAIGIYGYHHYEGLPWIDSLLNASMILGGMGPVSELHTEGGKLFASFYALYSGIFLIVCGGLLLAPVFHRILHHFHSEN